MRHYSQMIDFLKDIDLPIIKNNKKIEYYNIECGFDIETTSQKINGVKVAHMYIWQIGIGINNPVFYGRTWGEFMDLIEQLTDYLELNEFRRLPIYIHNLGYEFQFMRKYFEWNDVFSASERKPIRALTIDGIEFRDSYILSGYSLANTAKNLTKHTVKKLVGDLDYSLIRHYKTPLTSAEIEYCINDIQIILAYINEQIEICNGDISQIPMTNTGRVRKFVRDQCYYRKSNGDKANKGHRIRYRKLMEDLTIDVTTYTMLKRAFMGGFTHANSLYTGQVLEGVTSIDFTSSYPSVMIAEKFPMSRFKPIEITSILELTTLSDKYALIFDAKFNNIKAKITQENYISESKCFNVINPTINNGRINKADSISTTLTEIDYKIMSACYEWESIEVKNVRYANKGYLPKPIIESILKLYQNKTELKGVDGFEVEYLLSKGMLNSIYGMSVTDVVKEQATYNDEWETEKPDVVEEIIKYNKSMNRFLYYAWGIWVTAYARRNLWSGILATGDDYVYSDTDSLKILNYETHKPYIKSFDNNIINKMKNMCSFYGFDERLLSPKTIDGEIKMMGVWDYEGTYNRFKTLGAKRYLVQHGDKLELTVAGLSKQNGLNHMLEINNNDPLKVFEMFDDNLTIPSDKTGKMTHNYVDDEHGFMVTDYLGNTEYVHTLSGVHLESCEFTLKISSQYEIFLQQFVDGYLYRGLAHE